MNGLDLLIIVVLFIQTANWAHKGFARRFLSLAGFWIGFVAGVFLAPLVLPLTDDPFVKFILAMFVIFALAASLGMGGHEIGHKLRKNLDKINLGRADAVLGVVFSLAAGLFIVWSFAAIVSGTPFRGLNRVVRDSLIVRKLNESMPPQPEAFSKIAGLINPENFPQIFLGPEPRPIAPVKPPSSSEVAAALEAAGESTVRFESIGCGGVVYGSGFVVAPRLVATNAHVVSGINNPIIEDIDGIQSARVVYFDPELDFALVRTEDELAGPVLSVSSRALPRGTTATALGYPGGGPLEADAAGVLRRLQARGLNIYSTGVVERNIYMLQTGIEPGNSGGPVVTADGTVIGMVFGRSEADENVAYAITGEEISRSLEDAGNANNTVSTGRCVR